MALRFDGEEAIRAILPVLPDEVIGRGGRFLQTTEGALLVEADLPSRVEKKLVEAGARRDARASGEWADFSHWLELIRPERTAEVVLRDVLFVIPKETGWLSLCSELVRLDCDDLSLTTLGDGDWAVLARGAPYYSVAGHGTDWQAFAPAGPVGVWIAWGWHHELADRLESKAGTVLLISPDGGWRRTGLGEWTDLSEKLVSQIQAAEAVEALKAEELPDLKVELRLVPSASSSRLPSLWWIPGDADPILLDLVQRLPEEIVERLELARFTGESAEFGALLRARPGHAPPILQAFAAYMPHPLMPTVYVPSGQALVPSLRARTLQRLLDPGMGRVGWLDTQDGRLRLHAVEELAFQPLRDLIVYLAEQDGDALSAWMGTTRFSWLPLPHPVAVADSSGGSKRREPRNNPQPEPQAPQPSVERVASARRSQRRNMLPVVEDLPVYEPTEAEQVVIELEQQWRDSPDEFDRWPELAEAYRQAGEDIQAALVWARVLWDSEPEVAAAWGARWLAGVPAVDALPERADPATQYAVIAHILADRPIGDVTAQQAWLDEHDGWLDVRSRWLARRAVAERAGGDTLALARGRDAVLGALRQGLVSSRDVPRFMRTSASAQDGRQLEQSLQGILRGLVANPVNKATERFTRVYVRLTVAWAAATLGSDELARAAYAAAADVLPENDPVHDVALGLYRAAIEAALRGLPSEFPLPPGLQARLDGLERFPRFKVDRLREASQGVLPRVGVGNPFQNFVDAEDEDNAAIPLAELAAYVDGRLADGTTHLSSVLGRIVALRPNEAAPRLQRVLDLAPELDFHERGRVLVETLSAAAALSRPQEAISILDPLRGCLEVLLGDGHTELDGIRYLRSAGRSLLRLRLEADGRAFLEALDRSVGRRSRIRLVLAGLSSLLGAQTDEALIDESLNDLEGDLPLEERIGMVADLAAVATSWELARATDHWRKLVPQAARAAADDRFSTNSHFSLGALRVVETLALAHVHPDRLLSPEGRARLEVEEHEIRLRIHREEQL